MALNRFTLRQLEIFSAVMMTGQVRGAGQRLHLSQAAVSQAIAELADALEITLFERRGRELVPTAAAHRLAALTDGPRQALDTLGDRLHGRAGPALAGPVAIAASSTIARYFLPAPLAALSREHPELSTTLSSSNSARVAARVAEGSADIGFIEGPADRNDLAVSRWRTDRLALIAPPDGPTTLSADTLDTHRWVMRESGSGTRSVFEQRLALAGIAPPSPTLTVDDSGAQVRAVAAGAGLACVSEAACRSAIAAGAVHRLELPGLVFERPLWRIRRARGATSGLADALHAALSEDRSDPS